jgi:hypothetical protein
VADLNFHEYPTRPEGCLDRRDDATFPLSLTGGDPNAGFLPSLGRLRFRVARLAVRMR